MKEKDCNKSPDPSFTRPSSIVLKSGRSNCIEINHNAINCTFNLYEQFKDVVEFVSPSQLPIRSSPKVVGRCEFCNEPEDVIIRCSEPLHNALNEDDVLNSLKTSYHNETPCLTLNNFRIYDEMRHLCAFDGKLLEDATCLYFSGFVQPFDSETSDTLDGYPCEDIGPIEQWWIQEKDETTKIGLSSENAYYYLEKPMPEYIPFIKNLNEKVFMSRTVISILQKESYELDYDGFLKVLSTITPPDSISSITENVLLRHGTFICRQVQLFDNDADNEAKIISVTPCIETLGKKVFYNFNETIESDNSDDSDNEDSDDDDIEDIDNEYKRSRRKKPAYKNKFIVERKKRECIVTTTPLVKNIFMDYLTKNTTSEPNSCKDSQVVAPDINSIIAQVMEVDNTALDQDQNHNVPSNRELSVKVERLSVDVVKFYSKNKVSDHRNFEELPPGASNLTVCLPTVRELKSILLENLSEDTVNFFLHKYSESSERRKYLERGLESGSNRTTIQSDLEISVGDFVLMSNSSSIARVQCLYESGKKKKYFHAHWFVRSMDTILAETGHPNELFQTKNCEDVLLRNCCQVVSVNYVPIQADWSDNGNVKYVEKLEKNEDPMSSFYYQKRYCDETARFEDLEPESLSSSVACFNCDRKKKLRSLEIPVLESDCTFNRNNLVRWRNDEYRVGSCVFLNPNTIMQHQPPRKDESDSEEDYDEDLFPEKYRKQFTKKSRDVVCNPFDIGYVQKIWTKKRHITQSSDILLDVKKFYRPENTNLSKDHSRRMDLNLLYWSDEDFTVNLSHVQGKCYVSYQENLSCSVDEWAKNGPYRFYFSQSYNKQYELFTPPPPFAMKIGKIEGIDIESDVEVPPDYPPVARLRSFDVFCGCGGLTCGLEEANVAKCQWAVDKDPNSAHAFKVNFPDATVFNADANILLQAIIENKTTYSGQLLPQKGEVDILCGGPPCQGFSLLNRFPKGQFSKSCNTLIATYLSYCDHFKPRFFVMENVRQFVRHKSNVLKLTLNCLVRMGYQTAFFVLQSGRFGIPQSRSRVIIVAAAPGEVLPVQPEVLHTLAVGTTFETTVDDMKYSTATWKTSAPYRMIDVYDAISDMPPIGGPKRPYTMKPITHFQRKLRIHNAVEETVLKDHISFPLMPIVEKRISFIPKNSRCDWRDLPNIVVKLSDGTLTKKLQYTHEPKSPKGSFRGVCSCNSNGQCSRKYRQLQTLIPWCLSHTANRNAQWAGFYCRLRFDHLFLTVCASVSPSFVRHLIHPIDNRIVSIREYGRSVGFPDRFQFHGSVASKYRQIGNCVAPPLGKAIGLEIRTAIVSKSDTITDVQMSNADEYL